MTTPRRPLARAIFDLSGRWYIALACVVVLAGAVLLPGLGDFGLWEPQERQLADRIAPRGELVKQQADAANKLAEQQETARKQLEAHQTVEERVAGLKALIKSIVDRPVLDPCLHQAPKDALARTLTTRAVPWGRDHVSDSDGGRRMPLALLGFLTVLATAGVAMRGGRSRAGVLTALVLVSMPLLVLQSRQLTSEIGTAAGAALIIYGLVAFGRATRLGIIESIVALAALAAGLVFGFVSGGALLGVLVPIGAYAAAGGLGVPAFRTLVRSMRGLVLRKPIVRTEEDAPVVDQIKVVVATIAMIAVIGVLAYQLYDLREPQPGAIPPQRALFGKAIVPSGCWSEALGAIWRPDDDLRYIYDSTFEQIAYGTFPWGILAPIAMFSLIASADRKKRQIGALALAWAGGAWIASEAFQRKVGFSLWAGFPALALAIGVWLDGVFAGRAKGDREAMPRGAPLIGLFVVIAILDLGKDMQSFSERVTSILVGNDAIPYPTMSKLLWLPTKLWILIIGLYVGLGFVLTMALWRDDGAQSPEGNDRSSTGPRELNPLLHNLATFAVVVVFLPIALPIWIFVRLSSPRPVLYRMAAQAGAAATIVFSLAMALYWAFLWQPMLGTHLSSKSMFDTYLELRKHGDALVVMGDLGDAPYDYAPDAKPELVQSREQIVAALGRSTRVFAISPQTERCQLHREIGGKPYYVIDDRNQRSWLLSNKVDGTTDKNPLAATIVHTEPKNIPIRPKGKIVFDSRIELLGWDIPKTVDRGAKFEVKMFYKVLQPVGGAWTVLFHFDGALRFNGDHPPIDGLCQTSTWQKDDYIIDTHTVIAGGGAFAGGKYEVWTGFFTGSNPNWKNMPVSEAPGDMRDTADRVKITSITLE
ncbi:MAG: hypothetical protein JWO36_3532 [Myxococcales bacterium]|nr:hypothetical protein [Myxococcales bacterium]